MGPLRTKESAGTSSGASASSQHTKQKKHRPYPKHPHQTEEDAVLGVQKLKASLRQTRRLLAKESLAANVRVETERRQKALEEDLARAEEAKRERTFATRYHKVKFFERQKVGRKIKQAKRDLPNTEGKEKKKLEWRLTELRIDLNYILHFPKSKKYISLFPPEVRNADGNPTPSPSENKPDDNDDERAKIRGWIREQMINGDLSAEPEIELSNSENKEKSKAPSKVLPSKSKSTDNINLSPRKKQKMKDPEKSEKDMDVAGDDFFGNDSESDGDNASEHSKVPDSDDV
ncbi:hypothetical protein BJ138DRAFT_1180586 [Hygrophoropsis aurantiaca]|uniref:Uncharacterized protein n=1 Tax=Hygrophoropsis aurantiaca TaxID=72124 RepID=A0ACB8AAE3_9AGAM|nr:hypothetical protein BJ138DRAFT_1180586 [Hygrophoropsis aurantiaca]